MKADMDILPPAVTTPLCFYNINSNINMTVIQTCQVEVTYFR